MPAIAHNLAYFAQLMGVVCGKYYFTWLFIVHIIYNEKRRRLLSDYDVDYFAGDNDNFTHGFSFGPFCGSFI